MDDELPRVTLAHARGAEVMCRRRLEREYAGAKGNWAGSARFTVNNRLVEDARVAHTELRAPVPSDFPTPHDLFPEQQRLYRAAACGYLALFGARPARAVPADGWETELPELGVRLVGAPGLALERERGEPELRSLLLGVAGNRPLVDDQQRNVIVLRNASWVGSRPLHLVIADLVEGVVVEEVIDVAAAVPAAHEWLGARIAVIRERIADPVPKAGADCRACPFVNGCKAHAS